jgi:hypothetical protein
MPYGTRYVIEFPSDIISEHGLDVISSPSTVSWKTSGISLVSSIPSPKLTGNEYGFCGTVYA